MRVTLVMVHLDFQNSRYPSLSYLIDQKGKEPACPFSCLSHPCMVAAVPRESIWLRLHLCWLLIEAICAEFYRCFFLFPQGKESRFSWQSADVMTATTNKRQALQSRIKGLQTPL